MIRYGFKNRLIGSKLNRKPSNLFVILQHLFSINVFFSKQNDNTLVSCGAGDGIIKVWDLRRNYTTYKKEPLPKHSIPYPGTSTFKGYTNLMVDQTGLKLYVNCMDNNIYCYNLSTYSAEPLLRYVGLRNSTFYIKSSLSPDGQYLLSGSSDEKAYIWNINTAEPLLALVGHTVEVTCVAWSQAADMRLVTCSDDARHKIWRVGPELIEADQMASYRGHADFCSEYRSNYHRHGGRHPHHHRHHLLRSRLKQLENTPRSVRRLVERNETTPNSVEKSLLTAASALSSSATATKRSYCEANGLVAADVHCGSDGSDTKRPHIESRGRRLFSPSGTSAAAAAGPSCRYLDSASNLAAILEEVPPSSPQLPSTPNSLETTPTHMANTTPANRSIFSPPPPHFHAMKSPETPTTSFGGGRQSMMMMATASAIFSPTSNLPNFVVNGEAPHLPVQSPKRKMKENVDWLTKIRKQKLMTTINSQLNDKLGGGAATAAENLAATSTADYSNDICMSPRMQSLRACSPARTPGGGGGSSSMPKRRSSRSGSHHSDAGGGGSGSPSSRRRNSETSILRFFTVKSSSSNSTATAATIAAAASTDIRQNLATVSSSSSTVVAVAAATTSTAISD